MDICNWPMCPVSLLARAWLLKGLFKALSGSPYLFTRCDLGAFQHGMFSKRVLSPIALYIEDSPRSSPWLSYLGVHTFASYILFNHSEI